MSAPQYLDVLIEGDDSTRRAKQIPHNLDGVYGATLYEDDLGRQFFVDNLYISECLKNNTHASIPMDVITHREAMLEKLQRGQEILGRQDRERKTGLIIPDGIKV